MDLADQIKRIRRFLRDPNSKIWSDDLLTNLYNDVQEDLQRKTSVLVDITSIRVPPMYQMSYMHDWEWPFLPAGQSQFYQCFNQNQQSDLINTNDWEPQQIWSLVPDVQDNGAHFTHPWEAMLSTPGDEMKIRFPKDYRSARHISYNREPLSYKDRSSIVMGDSSYKTWTGDPLHYYRPDELDNSFVLYPRPTVATWVDGEGNVLHNDNDTLDSEVGVTMRRYDTTPSGDAGLAIDVIDSDYNVTLIYEQNTTDLSTTADTSAFPLYLRKYIEYGVISRAYGANTDGRIGSLSSYWETRYDLGVLAIKRFMHARYKDRHYQLETKTSYKRSRKRHPRLPSTYPDAYI